MENGKILGRAVSSHLHIREILKPTYIRVKGILVARKCFSNRENGFTGAQYCIKLEIKNTLAFSLELTHAYKKYQN
jgi:hypothetical protein